MRRALLAAVALLAAAIARRLVRSRRERVDLYFADGSMVSLGEDSTAAQRLFPLARDVLHQVRDRSS